MDFHEKLGFALWRVGNHMVDETVEAADEDEADEQRELLDLQEWNHLDDQVKAAWQYDAMTVLIDFVAAANDEVGGRGGGAFLEGVVAGSTTGDAQPAKVQPLTEQERLHLGERKAEV
jgi:hypothetical protein